MENYMKTNKFFIFICCILVLGVCAAIGYAFLKPDQSTNNNNNNAKKDFTLQETQSALLHISDIFKIYIESVETTNASYTLQNTSQNTTNFDSIWNRIDMDTASYAVNKQSIGDLETESINEIQNLSFIYRNLYAIGNTITQTNGSFTLNPADSMYPEEIHIQTQQNVIQIMLIVADTGYVGIRIEYDIQTKAFILQFFSETQEPVQSLYYEYIFNGSKFEKFTKIGGAIKENKMYFSLMIDDVANNKIINTTSETNLKPSDQTVILQALSTSKELLFFSTENLPTGTLDSLLYKSFAETYV